jgi:2-polyprenyl-6-methoxyphenol hydroxylase-like FAD-dependent oxidoreductase
MARLSSGCLWSILYSLLKESLHPGLVHAGEALVRLEQLGDEMLATFASGRVERADLLVGADGPRSTVRQWLSRGDAPAYAGYVAWRGLLPEGSLDREVTARLTNAFAFQQGPDHQMLTYLIPGEDGSIRPGERRLNWVWYRNLAAGRCWMRP